MSRLARTAALAVVTFAIGACADSPIQPAAVDAEHVAASMSAAAAVAGNPIPGRFIVTLREGAHPRDVARAHGIQPQYVYTHALNGFAGSMSEAARSGLLRDARVARVEQDGIVTTMGSGSQSGATWGLDRIDQRSGRDGIYTWNHDGSGVSAYIIDTGIRTSHDDFGTRATAGFDAFTDGRNAEDCNGHGTHVAGTVGGTTYGVAKAVRLVAVRVLDCAGSGSWSGVIAGIDWVAQNHVKPAVANMSLGGGASVSVDDAVNRLIASGVTTVVAAGNGNQAGRAQDACNYSPARVPDAITIGATTSSDAKTSWSNYGNCVDWFAPGASITSAWHTSNTATNTISGTSMAAPHVAGVAALYLSSKGHTANNTVRDALFSFTTKSVVTSSSTTNNHLLFNKEETGSGGGGGGGGGCTHPNPKRC